MRNCLRLCRIYRRCDSFVIIAEGVEPSALHRDPRSKPGMTYYAPQCSLLWMLIYSYYFLQMDRLLFVKFFS